MGRAYGGLGDQSFGIDLGSFSVQAETIEVHTPELNVTRTAILDYFNSPEQLSLEKIFKWETGGRLEPELKEFLGFLRY